MQSTNTRHHKILVNRKINFFVAVFCCMMTQFVTAQIEPPTLMPGIAGVYSTELDALGWNARLYFATDHHVCFGPEISYFKKNTEDEELTFFEANANLHYIFDLDKGLGIYPLAGVNYSIETEKEIHNNILEKETEEGFGLNLGAGLHYAKGRFLFFTEYKYVVSEWDDHFFTLGCLINFSLAKKNSEKHAHE